jgi:hypothetical protein
VSLNDYTFERSVEFKEPDGSKSWGRIDLHKRGCFVMETKQSREKDRPKALVPAPSTPAALSVTSRSTGRRAMSSLRTGLLILVKPPTNGSAAEYRLAPRALTPSYRRGTAQARMNPTRHERVYQHATLGEFGSAWGAARRPERDDLSGRGPRCAEHSAQ